MIEESRVRPLNHNLPQKGEYILYWMQASQRSAYNHALEYAIEQGNKRKEPVLVVFGLSPAFPESNERHYGFMLEGLKEVRSDLNRKGIGMVIENCSSETSALRWAKNASMVICDRGYLKIQMLKRAYVADHLECPLIQVETDAIVPVETASEKEEYSAATLRRKLHRNIPDYLHELEELSPLIDSTRFAHSGIVIANPLNTAAKLDIDHSVRPSPLFHGGIKQAKIHLKEFIERKLPYYEVSRNDPNEDVLSNLSPYLHFGQISPLYIALQASSRSGPGREAFLEELIIRRELSLNFVNYNSDYDSYLGLPQWARKTLFKHIENPKPYQYTREELEKANTHDIYWNASQKEMVITGKMHGYMRMYWGKKILEWSKTPEDAHTTAIYLNNKYEIDGRDPNGYTGVAWCFGKHDRPWAEHPVFGNIRFMSAEGLKRKFDADKYAGKFSSL